MLSMPLEKRLLMSRCQDMDRFTPIGRGLTWLKALLGMYRGDSVDVLIAGSNPLLVAVALHRAALTQKRAAVWMPEQQDIWNYNSFAVPVARQAVNDLLAINADVTHFESWIKHVLRHLFKDCHNIAKNTGWSVRWLHDRDGLSLRSVQGDGFLTFTVGLRSTTRIATGYQELLAGMVRPLRQEKFSSIYPASGASSEPVHLFADRLILVSQIPGFIPANVSAKGDASLGEALAPYASLFGSAAKIYASLGEAIAAPVDDVKRLLACPI